MPTRELSLSFDLQGPSISVGCAFFSILPCGMRPCLLCCDVNVRGRSITSQLLREQFTHSVKLPTDSSEMQFEMLFPVESILDRIQ